MERVTLKSGRQVLIRPIRPDDASRLTNAYDHLSPRSRYQRFLAPKPHLSATDIRYLVEIDGRNHVALIATSTEDPDVILGVGRFVQLPEDPGAAEFAIVVGDPYQGEGLGSLLLDRLADRALELGLERFRATTLTENEPAQRLMRRLAHRQTHRRTVGHLYEFEFQLAA